MSFSVRQDPALHLVSLDSSNMAWLVYQCVFHGPEELAMSRTELKTVSHQMPTHELNDTGSFLQESGGHF